MIWLLFFVLHQIDLGTFLTLLVGKEMELLIKWWLYPFISRTSNMLLVQAVSMELYDGISSDWFVVKFTPLLIM